MTIKLSFLIFLMFIVFSTEIKTILQVMRDVEYENQSKTKQKTQRPKKTEQNAMTAKILVIEIYWEDPTNLVPNEIKENIKLFLQKKGESLSNSLFDCISCWFPPVEVLPFVKALLDSISENVDVKKRGKYNKTPMMIASYFNATTAVVKLIGRGAETEATDDDGWVALHFAAGKGNESICEVLLRNDANINVQTKDRLWTPLMCAAGYGRAAVVKLLLSYGADTKRTDKDGKTALKRAQPNCTGAIRAHETKLNLQNQRACVMQTFPQIQSLPFNKKL